jgi:hypothetical protein
MDTAKWLRLQWDRALAWVLVAAGAVALIIGWIGVSGTAYSAEQLPYIISGGIGGLFLLGVGAVLWLSADLRDEWRKLDAIEEQTRQRSEQPASELASDPFTRRTPEPTSTEASAAPTNGGMARRSRPLRSASANR